MPAEEEITSNTLSVSVEEIQINTGFPADAFEFVPPDEADVSAGPGGRLSFGGGWSGFASSGKDDSGALSTAALMNGKARPWSNIRNGS